MVTALSHPVTTVWLFLFGNVALTSTCWVDDVLTYVLAFTCVAVSLIFGQFKLLLLAAHSAGGMGGVQTQSSGGYRSRQRSGQPSLAAFYSDISLSQEDGLS